MGKQKNLRHYPEAFCSLQKIYLGEKRILRGMRLCQYIPDGHEFVRQYRCEETHTVLDCSENSLQKQKSLWGRQKQGSGQHLTVKTLAHWKGLNYGLIKSLSISKLYF